MEKVFILEDLCCANCAAKIEHDAKNLEGVLFAGVNFMTQKLTVEYEASAEKDLVKKVKKIVKKYEPDIQVEVQA